jgi:uncharacterized membrane protein YphA (DoxX/SURF4 family)
MEIILWVIQGLLAISFLISGAFKLFMKREDVIKKISVLETYKNNGIRTIGLLEILGAVALILPKYLDILPVLTPIAAVCLGIIMILAIPKHMNKNEPIAPNVVLLVMCVVVAVMTY